MTDVISLAGIPFSVTYCHKYLASHLADYRSDAQPLFALTVTAEQIDEQRRAANGSYTDGYLESLAFYRLFCTKAAEYGVILFHSCVMEADGKAYLFAAPSGTGKSTHGGLWLKTFGDRVRFLNGDKPLLRVVDGIPTAFGTPFRGKESFGYNGSAPIGGICFLDRAAENSIEKIASRDAIVRALTQLFIPESGENAQIILDTQMQILNSVPLWHLHCNISREAAETSFFAMTGRKNQ